MRRTEPQVRLLAEPQIDWEQITDYLDEVDGKVWADRKEEKGHNDAETLIEFGGRLCYRSWAPGLNANVSRVREDSTEYLRNILKSGHGSVLEHANFTFLFHNVSRVFTHELVRHRAGAAYSQESMRFVRLTDIPFWFPEWATADKELMQRAEKLLADMEEMQVWMADHFGLDDDGVPFHEKKAKTSFMRRFAPDGVSTGIVFTANVRTLRHVIEARTAAGAEEEIRLVFQQVIQILQKQSPALFGDFEEDSDGAWIPNFHKV